MVAEYARRFYNPAVAKWRHLTAEACFRAKALSTWKSNMSKDWPGLAIKDVKIHLNNGQADTELNPKQSQLEVGSQLSVRALVKLTNVSPDDVSVELYHGSVDSWGNISDGSAVRMAHKETSGQDGEHWFAGLMSCRRTGQYGVAVRVLPKHTDLVSPYELGLILWETTAEKRDA